MFNRRKAHGAFIMSVLPSVVSGDRLQARLGHRFYHAAIGREERHGARKQGNGSPAVTAVTTNDARPVKIPNLPMWVPTRRLGISPPVLAAGRPGLRLGEVPVALCILGEDLVLFRDKSGRVGLLDRHCCHRGTSLEFGIIEGCGIRCCYHSWKFDIDGRILETPGEPANSKIKHTTFQGAYPALEFAGLVFAYMGPPQLKRNSPIYDAFDLPDDRMVPYSLTYPCNWLQIFENVMDPAHGVFLHTRISFEHFAPAWGELPVTEFRESPARHVYITSRRVGDLVWVRMNDIILPNLAQAGAIWEAGDQLKAFTHAGLTAGPCRLTIRIRW